MNGSYKKTKPSTVVIAGILGFGIGGLLLGLLLNLELPFLGFPLEGAIGGLALGLAVGKKPLRLALFGALGFGFGFIAELFISLALWDNFIVRFLGGGVGGLSLGLALGQKRQALYLALAGALGFGIGEAVFSIFRAPQNAVQEFILGYGQSAWASFGGLVRGLIGGAVLGLTLGIYEQKN